MADLTGHQLGNYRLVRHLGWGGFAEVYLGEHLYLKSEAALKVLRTSPKGEDMERFLKEAQTLVGLRHPNIVRVLEFGVEGTTPFLVTDYAPGGTVRYRYPKGSRLPLTTTVAYVKQVASALQYAHNRGTIHRDVKPENILLDSDQHLLLSDFGLALFAPSPELLSTQEGAGTATYMSPEQLQGKPTFASDQYSLGIVTYEWLCGKRPFEGNYWALINQHMHVAPAPLRQVSPELSAAVETVVLRALTKDPRMRFVSVQAYALALEQASRENTVSPDVDSQLTDTLIAISPSSTATPTARSHSPYSTQAQRRIFLTSAPADEAFAMRLQADLQARGVLVFTGRLASVPDTNQQSTLRQVIRDAQIALIVISPHARSSQTLKERLRIASMYQRHLVFVWAEGNDVASVLPETWGRTAMVDLVDARETRYRAALDEIIAFLEAEISVSTPEGAALPAPLGEPRNPYKGLHAFTKDDAADFFGRDALVEELAETIERFLTAEKPTTPPSRLLAVIGPSGSGKSSVVMAGLLPGLQKGALPGSDAWVYLDPIKPGQQPLESLIQAFAPLLPERSLRVIRRDLEDDSARGLHLLATQLVKRPGVKVVLTIDQFEELFTQTLSEQERLHFINLLVTAVTEPRGPLLVLLTLRADFSDRPMHYPQLSQLIEAHHTTVLPMNPHELRTVIEQPAILPDVQLLFEDNLVGDLLFEAQGQAGALPLLEFTLDQLFHLRDGHWLTRKAYEQIGGVKGALAKHAESIYTSLPSEEHRRLACALFQRLIDPGDTEQDTARRRVPLEELSFPDPEQTKIMRDVADTFVAARLLMTNKGARTTTIEVSHEALIREWTRLAQWLREARKDIHLQQALSEDVAEWEQRGKPKDRLYRGSQFKEARALTRRNVLNSSEVAFLQASNRRRIQSALGVVIVVLLLLSTTGVAGWVLSHQPSDPRKVTTTSDDGLGSLRWAIENAPAQSQITFDSSLHGTILLTSRDLIIGKPLQIQGPGANTLAISSGSRDYKVNIAAGAVVSISDLTFSNSKKLSSHFINNAGSLTLTNSVVSGNAGGIYNRGSKLTLDHTVVSENAASSSGGGIFNDNSMVNLIDSAIVSNVAEGRGGGIYNVGGTVSLINSTARDNSSTGDGGGIFSFGTLTLTNSTVSGNMTIGNGGGIMNFSPTNVRAISKLTLTNSTISENTASGSNSSGGGIFNGSQINLIFCTIYGNTATDGGGIYIVNSSTDESVSNQVQMRNSLVVGNHAQSSQDIMGSFTSLGYNLIQDVSGATFVENDQYGTDLKGTAYANPRINPALTGDLLQTHALLPGSPAIDKIPLNACHVSGISTDQRGVKRPQGIACDIGAYEYTATP